MYCDHCGAKISDKAKYCPRCGWQLDPLQPPNSKERPSRPEVVRTGMTARQKVILIAAVAVLAGMAGFLAYTLFSPDGGGGDEGTPPAAGQDSEGESVQEQTQPVVEPDEEALKEFYRWFIPYGEGLNGAVGEGPDYYFDCMRTDTEKMMMSVMWNVPCVNYDVYPGEAHPDMNWSGEMDPRGWAESAGTLSFYAYDADKVDWIMRNIFNYSQEEIDAAVELAGTQTEEGPYGPLPRFYLEDGKYYYITGGLGWETEYDISIDSLEWDGQYYDVVYTVSENIMGEEQPPFTCTAKMQYKEVDGEYYWSMFKNQKE